MREWLLERGWCEDADGKLVEDEDYWAEREAESERNRKWCAYLDATRDERTRLWHRWHSMSPEEREVAGEPFTWPEYPQPPEDADLRRPAVAQVAASAPGKRARKATG
jgi:hypothetical protein